MTAIKEFFSNAILRFGMRRRSKRALTLVLLLLPVAGITALLIVIYGTILIFNNVTPSDLSESGTLVFIIIAGIHIGFSMLTALGAAAGEITGEKQRQTMDLLVCSQMSPSKIILGKLTSSCSFILLISCAMLPLYSGLALLGGVTVQMLIATYVSVILFSFFTASVAIFFSTVTKKTAAAEILAFLIIVAVFAIWLILALICELINEFMIEYMSRRTFILAQFSNIPLFIQADPGCFLYMIFRLAVTGFEDTYNYHGFHETFVTLIMTPLQLILISVLCVLGAIKNINPQKSPKNKS